MRIAVFNTFDISRADSGGEVRLHNIYRRLSRVHEVRFVSYDLRCEQRMSRSRIAPALDLVTAAVSEEDWRIFYEFRDLTARHPHDILCASEYGFTAEFHAEVRSAVRWADSVVLTHPYLAPLVIPLCASRHLKIYESHNNEARTKRQYFAGSREAAYGRKLIEDTIRCEALAIEWADIVLAVSSQDAESFHHDYALDASRVSVLPNGVDVELQASVSEEAKVQFRELAGLSDCDVGVFVGSGYGPNVESYRLARKWLDDAGFSGVVLVIGRISEVRNECGPKVGFREEWCGYVDDETKRLLVAAADFGLNLSFSGGGTSLKLFDYMAAGTPIIANEFGSRGVAGEGWFLPVESGEDMAKTVRGRAWASSEAAQAAVRAHEIALRDFDWSSIVDRYREILR